eukprot:gene17714-24679_t
MFKVSTSSEVKEYLLNLTPSINCESGEAHHHNNHNNNGTPDIIERVIRTIKELTRFAMLYILNNPNFSSYGFTKIEILKTWGEIFNWALIIVNLKPSFSDPTKTKYEVYHNVKPDLRAIRLLPIFASVNVEKHTPNVLLNSIRNHWQNTLYIGPSLDTPGAIRALIKTNKTIRIVVTTKIKAITDGGDQATYDIINRVYLTFSTTSA